MRLHQVFNNGQAQPGAFRAPRARLVGAIQSLEDAGQIRPGDADWREFMNDYWGPVCRFAQGRGNLAHEDAEDVAWLKRARKTLPQIAHDLNVDALVEGGIVRSGGRVRITAQLVAADPERHIWASSYERDAGDIIGLQREIAEAVAREIRATLSVAADGMYRKSPVNPKAYEFYLRGREHLNDLYEAEFPQAAEFLKRAIALDSKYAPAHASLAMAYTQMGFLTVMPRDEASHKAKEAAALALTLDDNLAEAHTASAYARFLFDWDWRGPEAEFRRALELNPNSADAHLLYSLYLTFSGRFDDAIRENQLAIRLDPLNSFVNFNLGWTFLQARRYAEGISFMQELQRQVAEIIQRDVDDTT